MPPIEKYFNAEKSESALFILVGLIAICVALYFILKLKQSFYVGMAIPLMAVALIQITVGTTVYIRSPKDIVRVNDILQKNKSAIQTEEIPRMHAVMKNFGIYKWIEIFLLLAGIAIFIFLPPMSFWKGIGLGLLIQAGFMLLLDFFAERRGEEYLNYLQSMLKF